MRWTKTHKTRSMIGVFALVGISLVGCTAQPSEAETPRPSVSVSASPTPTADAAGDEELLPMPVEDIRDWATTAVPSSTSVTGTGVLSGWLSQNTSAHHLTTFSSLAPGSYQGQIACRGAGTVTLGAGEVDSDPSSGPVVCADGTTAFDVTIEQTGMSVVLDLEGDPTVYALSLVRTD
ncbi:hypothetical protein [Microbacterium oleivorans]|uniref:Uncharacterized protein n=1 Tax=Microbacterium oleivorans TaxID=273677 RepID=A0A7D5ITP2_9MICO|nr:hypothetical protein [Microbacterium oleivorans]QLD12497.1 hypothetical protein HW566_12400 [Microbacterium oleivorans]